MLIAIYPEAPGGRLLEALLELDYRPLRYNILNIMTRREEGYHDEIRAGAAEGRLATPDVIARHSDWAMVVTWKSPIVQCRVVVGLPRMRTSPTV